jgi:hypothetical protein
MQIYDYKQKVSELNNKFKIIKTKLCGLTAEIETLQQEQQSPNSWQNVDRATQINKQLKLLQNKAMIIIL